MVQINVNTDGMPKTLSGDQCPTFFISFIAGYILSGVSLFTSTAISLDRLLSLLLGLKYNLVVTLKPARFIVTIIWIVGVVCSALYLWNDQIPLTYAYVCTWICLVISVFSYTKIFVTLRYRQTQVQDLINQHANPTSPMNILRLIKVRVTLPLTHIFHKIENNLAILQGIFLILGRNVYHYHLSRTEVWQRNMILSTVKNSSFGRQIRRLLSWANSHH